MLMKCAMARLSFSNTNRAKEIMHPVPNGSGIDRGGAKFNDSPFQVVFIRGVNLYQAPA